MNRPYTRCAHLYHCVPSIDAVVAAYRIYLTSWFGSFFVLHVCPMCSTAAQSLHVLRDIGHAQDTRTNRPVCHHDPKKDKPLPLLVALAKYYGGLNRLPHHSVASLISLLTTVTRATSPPTDRSHDISHEVRDTTTETRHRQLSDKSNHCDADEEENQPMSLFLSYNFTIAVLATVQVIDLRRTYLGARQILTLADLLRVDRWHGHGKPSPEFWLLAERQDCASPAARHMGGHQVHNKMDTGNDHDGSAAGVIKAQASSTTGTGPAKQAPTGVPESAAAASVARSCSCLPALFSGCTLFPCLRVLNLSNLGLDFDNTEDGEDICGASVGVTGSSGTSAMADANLTTIPSKCESPMRDVRSGDGDSRCCDEDTTDGGGHRGGDATTKKTDERTPSMRAAAVKTKRLTRGQMKGNAVLSYLLESLHGHPSLRQVDMSCNSIAPAMLPCIMALLNATPSLTRVKLDHTLLLPDELCLVDALCVRNRRFMERAACADATLTSCTAWQYEQVEWIVTYQRLMMKQINALTRGKKLTKST